MNSPEHFRGKKAIGHVAEAHARGIISSAEIHGVEIPGHISAGADAARDTCLIFLLFLPILTHLTSQPIGLLLGIFLFGWTIWRIGRASWLGWSRLERLHRILEQEKWEIEHNRGQEREELKELYRFKGFEGKLLDDVIDVLMADNDRLLRVMVEEELGLSLEKLDHPLKQGIGAGIGASLSGVMMILSYGLAGELALVMSALFFSGLAAAILAHYARNKMIPAVIWNISLALFSFGLVYYSLQFL